MKNLLVGMLALGSLTSFAFETTCKVNDGLYTNIDASYTKSNKSFKVKYLGNSRLELDQSLVSDFNENELHLMALSQSTETRVGDKVKKYKELESFAVSFEKRDHLTGKKIRIKIHEDKKFQLFVENSDRKTIHAYSGKCKYKLTKSNAKMMLENIRIANEKL